MKNIILPTDFSENAWKAMCYAVSLFGEEACNNTIINTYAVPMANAVTDVEGFYESLRKESTKSLEEIKTDFLELDIHADSRVEIICELGYIVPELVRLEESRKVDFIVMGTKGASGVGEYLIGSKTSEAIGKCESPVLCVPNKAKLEVPKDVLFSVDSDGIKYISVIQPIIDISHKFNSKIHFAYVSPKLTAENKAIQELDQFVIDNFYSNVNYEYEHIKGEMVEDEIEIYVEANNIDLVVMIKHDRGFWKNLFHKSQTKTMAFHSEVPLLVLHDKL